MPCPEHEHPRRQPPPPTRRQGHLPAIAQNGCNPATPHLSTHSGQVEPLEQIEARLAEATSLIDLGRLALSPQCGFATSVDGNAITPEALRAKLALLVRAASDLLPAPAAT